MSDVVDLDMHEQAAAIRTRDLSPVELMSATLGRIQALDPAIGAYVTCVGDVALAQARRAESEIAAGTLKGPLHGIPYALKDNIATRGIPTSAGSAVLADWIPSDDATCVRRLADAGAILLGKVALQEFAYSQANVKTKNPWDLNRSPGMSSCGSAAAVTAGMCSFAIGTDTGGSIRIPSSLTGVAGLKPTFGVVSRHGVIPLSWSLDHVGPIARSVQDIELVMRVLGGYDSLDSHSSQVGLDRPRISGDGRLDGLRIGVVAHVTSSCTPGVHSCFENACDVLGSLGARRVEFTLPDPGIVLPIAATLTNAEAAAYHGHALRRSPELFGPDVRRRLLLGSTTMAIQYLHAQRVQEAYRERFSRAFADLDVMVMPTVPITAPLVEEAEASAVRGALMAFTALANVLGVPALSVPAGLDEHGLPVGLQIVGKPYDDLTVLAVGRTYCATLETPRWSSAVGPNRLTSDEGSGARGAVVRTHAPFR